jgi:replication factor C subunit 1
MKPFDFVTMDLAFRRPDANAIRSRIASIAFREGLKLPANVIDQLVEGTRADIRQIINMLSTYKTTATTMSFDESKNLYEVPWIFAYCLY